MSLIKENYSNLNLKEEGEIVSDLVVGELLDAGLLEQGTDEVAVKIVREQFMLYRGQSGTRIDPDSDEIHNESRKIAQAIINEMIAKSLLEHQHESKAIELAEEEILVRWSMESL